MYRSPVGNFQSDRVIHILGIDTLSYTIGHILGPRVEVLARFDTRTRRRRQRQRIAPSDRGHNTVIGSDHHGIKRCGDEQIVEIQLLANVGLRFVDNTVSGLGPGNGPLPPLIRTRRHKGHCGKQRNKKSSQGHKKGYQVVKVQTSITNLIKIFP